MVSLAAPPFRPSHAPQRRRAVPVTAATTERPNLVLELKLSKEEKKDLVAFLGQL
jgi:hypothetical protein